MFEMPRVGASLPVLVTPAEDIPGVWVAHCLPIDLVTQGDSITHAVSMVCEALQQVVDFDLEQGRDPLKRAPAPPECWGVMDAVMRHGEPLTSVEESQVRAAAAMVYVSVPRDALPEHAQPEHAQHPEVLFLPWQSAALTELRDSQRGGC